MVSNRVCTKEDYAPVRVLLRQLKAVPSSSSYKELTGTILVHRRTELELGWGEEQVEAQPQEEEEEEEAHSQQEE